MKLNESHEQIGVTVAIYLTRIRLTQQYIERPDPATGQAFVVFVAFPAITSRRDHGRCKTPLKSCRHRFPVPFDNDFVSFDFSQPTWS